MFPHILKKVTGNISRDLPFFITITMTEKYTDLLQDYCNIRLDSLRISLHQAYMIVLWKYLK